MTLPDASVGCGGRDSGTGGLLSLDGHSLACVLAAVGEPCSLAALASTARSLRDAAASDAIWRPLLARDFDILLMCSKNSGNSGDTDSASTCLAATYAHLHDHVRRWHLPHVLRFSAVYTDGGCDGAPATTYWTDHAFQPNYAAPHCSDGSSNINVVALLQVSTGRAPLTT